jgi:hypothetical protein
VKKLPTRLKSGGKVLKLAEFILPPILTWTAKMVHIKYCNII